MLQSNVDNFSLNLRENWYYSQMNDEIVAFSMDLYLQSIHNHLCVLFYYETFFLTYGCYIKLDNSPQTNVVLASVALHNGTF